MDRLFEPDHLPVAHPHAEQRRTVTEVGAELDMGAGIRGADDHVGTLHDRAHRLGVETAIGGLEGRGQIFFQRQIEKRIERILLAQRGDIGDAFAGVLLIFRFDHLLDKHPTPVFMKRHRPRLGHVVAHFLPGRRIGERQLARRFR